MDDQLIRLQSGLVHPFLDLFFPRLCVGCQKEGAWLCSACRKAVSVQKEGYWREDCAVLGLLPFQDPRVRELIHYLKYNGISEAAGSLGELLYWHLHAELIQEQLRNAVLIPVPISKARQKQRGYNQAGILAEIVGEWLHIPVWPALRRDDTQATQVGKTAAERKQNKQFIWCGEERVKEFDQRKWVVFDDVVTTGSTLNQCSGVVEGHAGAPVGRVALAYEK